MPSFDGPNLTITLDPGVSGVATVNIDADVYSEWKDWVQLADNSKYPDALRSDGGADLTPGIEQGSYFFLQNQHGWRVRPAEEDGTIYVIGNLVPEDPTLPMLVPTVGNFNVLLQGLQPITQSVEAILTQQQEALYDGAVTINTSSGKDGTAFPVGTSSEPVKTYADALIIAANIGVKKFRLQGPIILTQSHAQWEFEGLAFEAGIVLNGQEVSGARFTRCFLSGAMADTSIRALFEDCFVENVTGFIGMMDNCTLKGTISFAIATGIVGTYLNDCKSAVPGTDTPILDLTNVPAWHEISIRGYNGGLTIKNFDHANGKLSVDMVSGHIILESTVSDGEVVLRGVGEKTDNSTGSVTINADGFVEGISVRETKQALLEKAVVAADDLSSTIYAEDGVTPIATHNISADGRTRTRTG